MIKSNISQVRREWEKTTNTLDTHARQARDEMMDSLIQLSMEEIKGERGVVGRKISFKNGKTKRGAKIYNYKDDPAISGQPPKSRTGNLRRSITGEKSKEGFGTYVAIVGPTMKYARHVELGGPKWKPGVKFPYMQPAWNKFQPIGQAIIKKHFSKGRV